MIATNWDEPIPERELFYHRERLRNRIFDCVIKALAERAAKGVATRAAIARRLAKDPGQLSRWFSGPSNWTIDTISDLMLALNAELVIEHRLYEDLVIPNYRHPLSSSTKPESASYNAIRAEVGEAMNIGGSGTVKTTVRLSAQ
jgi:hypothetical protein